VRGGEKSNTGRKMKREKDNTRPPEDDERGEDERNKSRRLLSFTIP
jgi:hypothetical protein